MFTRITRAVGASALAAGLLVSGLAAAPAQAATTTAAASSAPSVVKAAVNRGPAITVKKVTTDLDYKGRVLTVGSKGCKSFGYYASYEYGRYANADFTISVDLYRGNKKIKTITTRNTGLGKVTICPKDAKTRYGAYSLRNIVTKGSTYYWDSNYRKHNQPVTARQKMQLNFNVKGALSGKLYSERRGSKVSFVVKTRVFSDKYQKNVAYNPKGAKLQYKSGKKWKTLKTLKFKKGRATYGLRTSKYNSYRVTVPARSWATGGTATSWV